ncbi:MAG: phenylalanine--tRNA ligase subunit beta [Actinomycetes bacterium]
MKVPLSWLREYADISSSISLADIEEAFVAVGFEVDGVEEQGSDLTGPLVVAKVLSIEQVEGQKKSIRYVGLDCGEPEIRFVICGATNFAVGDLVIASLPGAILPGGFAIAARETYGHTSNGMICSARELGLGEDHTGIIVLNEGAPGDDAIALLQINDAIFDVAVNPDRGYALSIRGLARELAASLKVTYRDPAEEVSLTALDINKSGVQVVIDDPSAVSVIYIRTLKDFNPASPSPLWMRRRVEKCGMRSISLAVDVTNYVMLELGQPLHAFDAATIKGSIHIRRADRENEFKTLDGQLRKLSPTNLVVADESHALALAGTMGGLDSEVTESTTSLAIEAARFDPIAVAKNSRFHRLSSEASRRFERAVDPALAAIASARATQLLIELGGASYVGSAAAGVIPAMTAISFDPQFVSRLLGIAVPNNTVAAHLQIVGCEIAEQNSNTWLITPPSWRSDLLTPSDLVEEVGRLIGLNSIAGTLPQGRSSATLSPLQYRKRGVAQYLANLGFSEVYNYPFVNQEMVDTLGFTGARAASFKLANPMSDQAPLLRTHLLPGLLETAKRNLGRGAKECAIFEIGSVFRDVTKLAHVSRVSTAARPSAETIAEIYASVPPQPLFVGSVVVGSLDRDGWWGKGRAFDWSDATQMALSIIELTGNTGVIVQSDLAPWHPGRCAEIQVAGKPVAHAGELHPRVLEALGLPPRSCAFAVILSELPVVPSKSAKPIYTMPAATQDVSLIVDGSIPASKVEAALVSGAGSLLESITLFDRYEDLGDGKVSLAFTLTFRAPDRTLTADEVSGYRELAVAAAAQECGAIVRA